MAAIFLKWLLFFLMRTPENLQATTNQPTATGFNPMYQALKYCSRLHSMRTSRPGKLTGHHQPANSNLFQFNVPGFEVLQPVQSLDKKVHSFRKSRVKNSTIF